MDKLNELCQKYGTTATIEQQKEIIEAGKELEKEQAEKNDK